MSFAIVVMGVSGVGKSTLGRALAEATGYAFIEGDELHPAGNVAKMAAGIALDDADRWPWLARVAEAVDAAARGGGGIATCSALKRSYRDLIRRGVSVPVAFVHPTLAGEVLRRRMEAREGHYMPASLLASQLATLEPPEGEDGVVALDAAHPVEALIAETLRRLDLAPRNRA